jgi:flagellar basal body P-ring protein FlgI
MRSQSPEQELMGVDESANRYIGDLAKSAAPYPLKVDAVALINGLHGTGSDPGPTPQRMALIEDMQARGINNPNAVLSSQNVSLVVVQGWLRPGIQKGDRFDIELRVPSGSETTSLRGGYLLKTRLQDSAVLNNQLHHGQLWGVGEGPVLIDPMANADKDQVALCRGRVLGGGVALKSRSLGLVLTPNHKGILNASRVAAAINKRFHTYIQGIQTGVAKAKTAEYIELAVYPRYKDNIDRYFQVVHSIVLKESSHERLERITTLQAELLDPETASEAALHLEAIGSDKDSVETLCNALKSNSTEVRFYAAEALAYLDRHEAAEPLGKIARDEPAFRVYALAALSTMQDFAAFEQLRDMLSLPSAETRYGAFRSLWAMNPNEPFMKGELLSNEFHYHVLDVSGPPMVHVTRSRLAELVLFGRDQRLSTPLAVNAGTAIMVTSTGGDEISVSKFAVREGDQKRIVSTRTDDVIRAIVELGGTYPDVVQALQEAKISGAMTARFEVDALPQPGRSYERLAEGDAPASEEHGDAVPASPMPDLFSAESSTPITGKKVPAHSDDEDDTEKSASSSSDDSDEDTASQKSFFGKMFGR